MKSTIITEKHKITIGEIIQIFNINLIWFCILGINYLLNYYCILLVKNDSNFNNCNKCINKDIFIKKLKFYEDKLYFSRKLIYIGLFINLFLIITYKARKYFEKYLINYINYFELFPTLLYVLSSLLNEPIIIYNYLHSNENKILLNSISPNSYIFVIMDYCYGIFEIWGIIGVAFLLYFLTIRLITFIFEKIHSFYEKYIKNITFEYTESKFIDIEKNI